MLTRAMRFLNVGIALLALVAACVVYWLAFRPLPKVSGEINAPIAKPGTVERDIRGVPHIQASSWQDAIFLQGYVTAQDRLWQMDTLRRFASGELSEVFGPSTLEADKRSRRMRMRSIADQAAQNLRPDEREVFVEYARGVNYFIDTHRGRYSLEFSLPGHSYDPQPWTLSDSVLIGLVMYRNLTDTADEDYERGLARQSKGFDMARFHVLFPAVSGQYLNPGSNAWAVSGQHAVDGKPMLANDPHLEHAIPETWYMAHLKAQNLDVSGVSLPGVPCIISGHNQNIAWGVTNLEADELDLYQEQIDAKTGRYLFRGKLQQAQLDRQTIAVKGQQPVTLETWVTRHGPIIVLDRRNAFAMRWSAADGFAFPFMAVAKAADFNQFRAALSNFWGPPQNFAYADRAGHIGYQAAGRVPVRRNFEGDFPLDGASGNFEWDGYIPYEQMPNSEDPADGIVATANQDPFPPTYPYHVNGSFDDDYRVRQIRSRLVAKQKLSVDDMLAIQKDVYSAYDHFLAAEIVRASTTLHSKNALAGQAIDVLKKWNGQMEKDQAAPVITQFASEDMRRKLTAALHVNYQSIPRPFIVQQMLKAHPSGWVANDNWDQWIVDSFNAALDRARARLGTPVSGWRWGQILKWTFEHPVGSHLPLVEGLFDIGPVEMSGSGTTVKQTTTKLGPSERMVVDLGDLDKSVQNLVVGESGAVASGHYKDQWPAYYVGKSFPMQFEKVDARETLRFVPGK